MGVTRNGIYYRLDTSKYRFKVPDTNITFVFSSDLHLCKFEERYKSNREEQNIKFNARYRINVDTKVLPDILLYKKIETRGFLLIDEKGLKICQESLLLNGERVTQKN